MQSILKSCNTYEYIFVCIAAAGRECDIPPAPPVMQLRFEDFFKILSASQHHLHPNSRISRKRIQKFPVPEGRKIRLFCGYLKALVLPPTNPFESLTVAKGITH